MRNWIKFIRRRTPFKLFFFGKQIDFIKEKVYIRGLLNFFDESVNINLKLKNKMNGPSKSKYYLLTHFKSMCLLVLFLLLSVSTSVGAKEKHGQENIENLISSSSSQTGNKISGVIKDVNGEVIIGANIVIKGTTNGGITDIDGNFELSNVEENDILVVSYIGYLTQELKVQNQRVFNITLIGDDQILEEVVVVGYGTQRKKELTGSVTSLKSGDIIKVATNSFTNSIQGKIPGVQINQSSGAPGAGASVRIRGVGTTGGNEPLYVVDGLPIGGSNMSISGSGDNVSGLSIINPNDIESIEVLKDAAAAAIYGARAANGVIIITTKRGSEGLAKVNYNTYVGVQQLWKKPKFLNATQFATLANELYANSGMDPIEEFANPESLGKGTDWIDAVFKDAFMQNHDLSISGGTKNAKASLSLGYLDQDGTLIETWYKRYTGRLTVDLVANDYLKFGSTLAFTHTGAKGQRNSDLRIGIFNLAQQMYPNLGIDDVIDDSAKYFTSQADNPVLRAKIY
ncbi:SusC/RagA family TonB-linked outer membrane protein [Massilibacteroides sp.]|uniref:SusC/RagA family TonB-linked outer membrane protein n=1 Tax=Massilibacteroides sp. TaxID=2034766 RepID=UPI002604E73B|nr:SusC/RagA family TonB-linked outer membrane protein [Massilibacteroides sp.]MDD4514974.1 SusC/RagA family TonB-linked outer membrane protein [Massilibacteroides sp.]